VYSFGNPYGVQGILGFTITPGVAGGYTPKALRALDGFMPSLNAVSLRPTPVILDL
jgi:hypothetical protein